MYNYTLGFIKRKDEILLVNREKKPWKGSWNGVGGKINNHEEILVCIIREVEEETGIKVLSTQIEDKGYLTWNSFDANGNGLHIFLIHLPDDFIYPTPILTNEGILDWKKIEWINDFDNYGVAHNIPYFLPTVLEESDRYHYHCTFSERALISVTKEKI
ncbi:MAG: 8-oxo-dGTP diphosphatase [Acholeplasmataceae bacterium]|nr:8-oxo-dGTP diphosphatase [Acholeplasmataceae bacterium]